MCGNGWELGVDEALWVPGVDYTGGWRDATNVCDELVAALMDALPEIEGITAVAQSGPDCSGVVQLRMPPTAVRLLAEALRAATPGCSDGRAAS
jgi:hypothetical protein